MLVTYITVTNQVGRGDPRSKRNADPSATHSAAARGKPGMLSYFRADVKFGSYTKNIWGRLIGEKIKKISDGALLTKVNMGPHRKRHCPTFFARSPTLHVLPYFTRAHTKSSLRLLSQVIYGSTT